MASSRRLPTSYNLKTYGADGFDRDYTVLNTWESDTDNNLVTAAKGEVLECYADAASFDDRIVMTGATTNSSYFRVIKPATGNKHLGKPGSGVTFVSTTDLTIFAVTEGYAQIQDIIATVNISSNNTRSAFSMSGANNGSAYIGCIAVNCLNSGTGTVYGFNLTPSSGYSIFVVNCLSHNNESYGFYNSGSNVWLYNCTSTNNLYGFHRNAGTIYAKNCCASGNTTLDWSGTFTKTTCTAEDATPTYVDSGNDDFHLSSSDTVCKDNGTDLSSDGSYAFDDDVDSVTHSGTWDIGFDEYVLAIPIVMYYREHC